MRISEIIKKYGLEENDFNLYVYKEAKVKTSGFFGDNIADEDVETVVKNYREKDIRKAEAEKAKRKAEEAAEKVKREAEEAAKKKQESLSGMLISSGFSFEGYRIVKYSGYISGDDAVQIPRSGLWRKNDNGQNLTDALVKIRVQALKELKEAAYALGCNAVVGVDFDYITLEPQTNDLIGGGTVYEPYIICVTANGNAVVIEKE